jgi:putative ABC transport system ATP-binding protein
VGSIAGIAWMGGLAALPIVIGGAIDSADRGTSAVLGWIGAIIAVIGVEAVAGVVRHHSATLLYIRTRWLLEQLLTRRVLDPRGGMEADAGRLGSLASSDTSRVGAIADLMCRGAGAVVTFLAVGIAMVSVSPPLGVVVLIGLPISMAVMVPLWRPLDRRSAQQQSTLADASSTAADVLTGLRVVKGLHAENAARQWFARDTGAVEDAAVAVARLDGTWAALAQGIPATFLAGVVWLGGRLTFEGTLTAGELVAFTGLAVFLAIPLATLAEVGDVWAGGLASAKRLAEMIARPFPVDDPPVGVEAPRGAGLSLRNVGYRALDGIDLDIAAGELTGVACADHAVADSIVDLFGRRSDPETGAVSLGGTDVRLFQLDVLRGLVVVERGSNPWLTDGSLADNLALGTPDADRTHLRMALTSVAGEDLLARSGCFDQLIGERGLSLSGGQRQRVALARAVSPDSPVLVLEDPTSALDSLTEQVLVQRLAERRQGRTTLIVTTSATVLAACDVVILLDDGEVLTGSHAELLDDPRYRRLVDPGEFP